MTSTSVETDRFAIRSDFFWLPILSVCWSDVASFRSDPEWQQLPQPTIAKLHGHCFTGGLELALACDLLVAAESTKLGDTHGQWGLVPVWGMSVRLPERVGRATAKELMFTSRCVNGQLDLLVASGAIPIESLSSSSEAMLLFCDLDGSDGGGLVDSTTEVGLDAVDERNGRAVATADYDNDGDVDVVVTAIGQPLVLLENRGAAGQSITVDPGAPDPGMRVRVELSDGTIIERHALAGESWLSSVDPRTLVGFPDGLRIERVVVTRSNGAEFDYQDVNAGATLQVPAT